MKRFLLFAILVSCSFILKPQNRVLLPKEKYNKCVKADLTSSEYNAIGYNQSAEVARKVSSPVPDEHIIGNTIYDLQAFNQFQNRIYRYDDGSIGAVWTRGMQIPSFFPDKGTGYNFYNGTEWSPMPASRIESINTGWPSYAPLGATGEIVVSGYFEYAQLHLSTREVKGVGIWAETLYTYSSGPTSLYYPRMTTSGPDHNTIHVVASTGDWYLGQTSAIVYSRSQDGGISWNIENEVLEGIGVDYYTGIWPDQYVWADERAGTIALLCGSNWMDLFMLKSTDDGDLWEKTVIWEHPYPSYDFSYSTDNFFCMDNSASIALDSEGKAHVVFGINRVRYENGFYFYPYVDGIAYWNEEMDPFSMDVDALAPPGTGYPNSEMIEDYNYIGWMQDIDGDSAIFLNFEIFSYREKGPSTMPTITIDDLDQVFVLFSSTTESYEFWDYNFKHIWSRASAEGEWGPFIDLTASPVHAWDECIYPVLASSSDDYIHYLYNADEAPGIAVYGQHQYQENRVIYGALPKYDLLVGAEGNNDLNNNLLVVQNYPNPFSSVITLSYNLEKPSSVTIRIINAEGKQIYEIVQDQSTGKQQFLWNAEKFPAGLYYYRIDTGNQVGSGKMVLMK